MSTHQGKRPPDLRTIRGELYRLVLLEILTRDEFGRPLTCKIHIDDEAKINIKGGEHFVVAFAHAPSLEVQMKVGKA